MSALSTLRRAGHWPTLLAAFVYFDISFCVWSLLGPLGPFVAEALRLDTATIGLLVATPLLGGSFGRVAMGALADRIGARRAGLVGIAITFVPLLLGAFVATSLPTLFAVALLLGVPGASFAVALPLASRWYPPEHQGLVMGIAGAGNSGTVLAALIVPRLAAAYGWHAAIGLVAVPMALAGLLFVCCARESPSRPAPRTWGQQLALLREADTLWLCAFYALTFGGFVGMASFLGVFLHGHYGVDKVAAGDFTALCVFAGSAVRPFGGWLADRVGGARLLTAVYATAAALFAAVALLPPLGVAVPLLAVALATLGTGNGAVFQLVALRFRRDVGVVTGLVGAAGGLGGFCLPSLLGLLRDTTGSFAGGFALLAGVALWGCTLVVAVSGAWRLTWTREAAELG